MTGASALWSWLPVLEVPESPCAQATLQDIGISGVEPSICISKVPRGFHCADKPSAPWPRASPEHFFHIFYILFIQTNPSYHFGPGEMLEWRKPAFS